MSMNLTVKRNKPYTKKEKLGLLLVWISKTSKFNLQWQKSKYWLVWVMGIDRKCAWNNLQGCWKPSIGGWRYFQAWSGDLAEVLCNDLHMMPLLHCCLGCYICIKSIEADSLCILLWGKLYLRENWKNSGKVPNYAWTYYKEQNLSRYFKGSKLSPFCSLVLPWLWLHMSSRV